MNYCVAAVSTRNFISRSLKRQRRCENKHLLMMADDFEPL